MLPNFRYHPDPVATGNVETNNSVCRSCGLARGYIYVGPVYSIKKLSGFVCPWCISDGSAARKFDASFSDVELLAGNVSDDVIVEIEKRTPGFISWQQGNWLFCCGDVCEFHGDAPKAELQALNDIAMEKLAKSMLLEKESLRKIVEDYQPGGSPAVYKFICRHCRRIQYNWDCD